jgi:hypothetical protein
VNIGRALANESPLAPKGGARFHFELPGAVQGFQPEDSPESRGTLVVENVAGHSRRGQRSLALRYRHVAPSRPATRCCWQAATACAWSRRWMASACWPRRRCADLHRGPHGHRRRDGTAG